VAAFVLLVADDLMVASRIEATARHLGFDVRQAGTPDAFWAAVADRPALVLLGTERTRLDWETLLTELHARPDPPPVLAFGPHLDAAQRTRARAAGVTKWVPNSRLATELPTLIETLTR
jgi:DNA-binding response OmpR family regulator